MSRISRILAVTSVLVVSLGFAASARAAEEGGAGPAALMEAFKWVNFAIVAAACIWVFAKVLPATFRKNAENISSAITKATAAKGESDRQLREAETKLANLQREVAELRAEAQRESAADVERIGAATRVDVQKIGIAAKGEMEASERAARIELKALAARLAVDGAESLLVKQLTPAAQESLVDAFVKNLEGRPN